MSFRDRNGKPRAYSASEIVEVKVLPGLQDNFNLMLRTCEYFFKGKLMMNNPPFRGFILEGPPGTGKTELVKQVARKLDQRLTSVNFALVDGASIAAPKWGEGERNLRDAFHRIDELQKDQRNSKMMVLFDDIESLMITRGASMAKEWHYAINSILFHEIDALDPSQLIVCATSNRPDLVDEAIRTRLYPLQVPPLPPDSLRPVVVEILEASGLDETTIGKMTKLVMNRLKSESSPTIREARSYTVVACIESGVWSP